MMPLLPLIAASLAGVVLDSPRPTPDLRSTASNGTILSLYDLTGSWSLPYRLAGYPVVLVDLGHPGGVERSEDGGVQVGLDLGDPTAVDELLSILDGHPPVRGILAAPPCRVFTRSGARLWGRWDCAGETDEGLTLIDAALNLTKILDPAWWVLENPPGRLWNKAGTGLRQGELGPPRMDFDPCDFAGWLPDHLQERERYRKKTYLWGDFRLPARRPLCPESYPEHLPAGRRDWTSRKSSSWRKVRSTTPAGFALAFHEANP